MSKQCVLHTTVQAGAWLCVTATYSDNRVQKEEDKTEIWSGINFHAQTFWVKDRYAGNKYKFSCEWLNSFKDPKFMERTLKPSNISHDPLPNTFNQLKIQRSRTISIVSKCCLSVAIKSKKSQNSLSHCDKAKISKNWNVLNLKWNVPWIKRAPR